MGAVPETTNTIATIIDGFVKAAITGGEDAAEAYIGVQAPFLELPVINIFTNWAISLFGNAIYSNAANLVAIAVIDVQTNLEKSAFKSAVDALTKAKQGGDANAVKSANDQFNKAASALIFWDGDSSSAS